jgi:hypothetical protein
MITIELSTYISKVSLSSLGFVSQINSFGVHSPRGRVRAALHDPREEYGDNLEGNIVLMKSWTVGKEVGEGVVGER